MQIQKRYHDLSEISTQQIEACRTGRFYHWNRVYIVMADEVITVISLNMLNRFVKALQELVGSNYFDRVLKSKNIVQLVFVDAPKSTQQNAPNSPSLYTPQSSGPSFYFPKPPVNSNPPPGAKPKQDPKPNPGAGNPPPPDPKPPVPPLKPLNAEDVRIASHCSLNPVKVTDADIRKMEENIKKVIEQKVSMAYRDKEQIAIKSTDEWDIFRDVSVDHAQRAHHMPALFNYLLMTHQIAGYCRPMDAWGEYTLFLTQDALKQSKVEDPKDKRHKALVTKPKLIDCDSKLSKLQVVAPPPHFGHEEKRLHDLAQKEWLHQQRLRLFEGKADGFKFSFTRDHKNPFPAHAVLDFMLRTGQIAAWNIAKFANHDIFVLLDSSDKLPLEKQEWNPWRNMGVIQKEDLVKENFLKVNRVNVPPSVTLTKEEFALIDLLNDRSQHGPVRWLPSQGATLNAVLNLKNLGLIKAYQDIDQMLGTFHLVWFNIFAKDADIPPGDRLYVK